MSDMCNGVCDGYCSDGCVVVDSFGWRLHHLRTPGLVRLAVTRPGGEKLEVAQRYRQDMAGQGAACSVDTTEKMIAKMEGLTGVPFAISVALAGLVSLGSFAAEQENKGVSDE